MAQKFLVAIATLSTQRHNVRLNPVSPQGTVPPLRALEPDRLGRLAQAERSIVRPPDGEIARSLINPHVNPLGSQRLPGGGRTGARGSEGYELRHPPLPRPAGPGGEQVRQRAPEGVARDYERNSPWNALPGRSGAVPDSGVLVPISGMGQPRPCPDLQAAEIRPYVPPVPAARLSPPKS